MIPALIIICASMFLLGVIEVMNKVKEIHKERIALDRYAIHMEQDVIKSRNLMEKLIQDALIEWSLFNIRTENEMYMTDEKRNQCTEWVIRRVIENSSEAVIDQLGIGYPANNNEELINSIKNVAMISVMNFTIEQNVKMMDDDIPNVNIKIE